MLYVLMKNSLPIAVKSNEEMTKEDHANDNWKSRWDWKSYDEVTSLALYITAITGEVYLGVDSGSGVSPRYDIIKAPQISNEVSRCFNGDCYPCGTITKITKSWRVTTSDGSRFSRYKNSGTWFEVNGRPFSLVGGSIFTQNPHF